MGKRLDALFGRRLRISKLRPLINLALSRLAVLKTQRQARCTIARSDVVNLLGLGQRDRALLRVEQVIKEQNMIDVLGMIESYCSVVIERIDLIQEKECPEEMKEAVSSLVFASSRTGEFPELQQMRAVFASCFGKEFVARSVELRSNCGVNIKMIQKLSTRQPSLETRMKALKEIAAENGIDLNLEDAAEEEIDKQKNDSQLEQKNSDSVEEGLNESVGDTKRKYKDVADAAQQAFQSAANAAAAAKAAVELSRYRPPDTDNHDSKVLEKKEDWKSKEINASSMETPDSDVLGAKALSHEQETIEGDVISSSDQAEYSDEEYELKNHVTTSEEGSWQQKVQGTDDKKGPVSVRTRR